MENKKEQNKGQSNQRVSTKDSKNRGGKTSAASRSKGNTSGKEYEMDDNERFNRKGNPESNRGGSKSGNQPRSQSRQGNR